MDYEKKYNEALELAKSYYGQGCNEFLDTIFTELRESEDERIRKILIHIVKGACGKYGIKYKGDEITEEKLIAYLEKQKDHFRDDTKKVEKQDYSGPRDMKPVKQQ